MTNRELLQANIRMRDHLLDHDPEVCGNCYLRKLYGDFAEALLKKIEVGEPTDEMFLQFHRDVWDAWLDSKFIRLWRDEIAAGRDPMVAFNERGWDP